MADEKIIKFGKLQEKWEEQELDKLEAFMNSMVNDFISGKLSMAELSINIEKYRRENNISEEKMMKLQSKLVQNLGMSMGIQNVDEEIEAIKEKIEKDMPEFKGAKNIIFKDYYKDKIHEKTISQMNVKNEKNDLKLIIEENLITIITEKKVDFSDDELNEIIANYKQCTNDTLKIISCEATKIYEYH